MLEVRFWAMGCQMLAILDADEPAAEEALRALPQQFDAWEAILSRFRPDSELSQLNRAPHEQMVVSAILAEVLYLALLMAERSGGLVTPTILAALEAHGYDAPYDVIRRRDSSVCAVVPPPGNAVADWRSIQVDLTSCTVYRPVGLRIDLGGIAKGWAAQRAVEILSSFGPALVDAGGDIVVSGPQRDGSPWLIGVADPFDPDRDLATLAISTGAVATSGRDYRRWQHSGHTFHHLIDPRTNRPAETNVLTATAIAPTGPEAEMTAKVVLLLGAQEGLRWVEATKHYAALAVVECESPCLVISERARQQLGTPPLIRECDNVVPSSLRERPDGSGHDSSHSGSDPAAEHVREHI